MATDRKAAQDILQQLEFLGDVRLRPMMGEYILYYREKAVGGIYDNQVLLKKTPYIAENLPDAEFRVPYPGAREMLIAGDLTRIEFLQQLVDRIYSELPAPRRKRT